MALNRTQVLDRYFLEMRCKVLDLAACLDRLDRAEGPDLSHDSRLVQLRQAIGVLLSKEANRVEQVQLIFSCPYDPQWQEKLLGKS
jgi:hypothetical protein